MGDNGDNSQTHQEESSASLNRRYLYQNPTTGAISPAALTAKQLCRMFSPPISSTTDQHEQTLPISRFNGESSLLALQDDGQYDPAGWKPAKEIPILRHAACPAFYYCQGSTKTPQGPVSCRQFAMKMLQNMELDPLKDQVNGGSTDNQWVLIDSMPDLKLALEAFLDPLPPQQQQQQQTTGSSDAVSVVAQNYDVAQMIYEDINEEVTATPIDPTSQSTDAAKEEEVQDELKAFLSATDHLGPKGHHGVDEDEEIEGYESDGGTNYVKDPRTGSWIHQALAPPEATKKHAANSSMLPPSKKQKTATNGNISINSFNANAKKKPKKPKFSARNAKCWIYVTGLPPDTDEEEMAKFFSKVGIIDLDPLTQKPKVKLYRHKTDTKDDAGLTIKAGTCKGDASIGYARPESVELALQVLDEAPFREGFIGKNKSNPYRIRVQRAKFEQHGDYTKEKDRKKRISQSQRQVARLAAKQAVDWDDGEFNGRLTGGLKGLRIIVLKHLFYPSELPGGMEDDALLAKLEEKVRTTCEEFGLVEKITVFSKNSQGVVVVKFTQPGAATEAVSAWNGRSFAFRQLERKVEASYWDGVTDFTVRDEEKEQKEMEKRHDEFGAWLESHKEDELPTELRLKVETTDSS